MYLSLGGGNNEKLYFAGYFGVDAERMHFPAHQFTGRIINHAVAGDGVFAGKCLWRRYANCDSGRRRARTGMTGMAGGSRRRC
jgi:hypothetical protein